MSIRQMFKDFITWINTPPEPEPPSEQEIMANRIALGAVSIGDTPITEDEKQLIISALEHRCRSSSSVGVVMVPGQAPQIGFRL